MYQHFSIQLIQQLGKSIVLTISPVAGAQAVSLFQTEIKSTMEIVLLRRFANRDSLFFRTM